MSLPSKINPDTTNIIVVMIESDVRMSSHPPKKINDNPKSTNPPKSKKRLNVNIISLSKILKLLIIQI
jgi:hypothetical protein